MCEGNQGLVSYRAAVIGSQRSLVPLNYPLTQTGLLGLCGGALPAVPPNWCAPLGEFKPHKLLQLGCQAALVLASDQRNMNKILAFVYDQMAI